MFNGDFWDFNKQIVLGEIGALIGIQVFLFFGSLLTSEPSTLGFVAVAGSLAGAAGFWLITRILDEKRKKRLTTKSLASDIAYYTPAAVITVILVYLPLLKWLTQSFVEYGWFSNLAGIIAQIVAFFAFLVIINFYRVALIKWFKKSL